jgi:hypothetical protein
MHHSALNFAVSSAMIVIVSPDIDKYLNCGFDLIDSSPIIDRTSEYFNL